MSGCGERQTETDRKRERQRETERQRKTDSDSETERDRERQRETERDRESQRETEGPLTTRSSAKAWEEERERAMAAKADGISGLWCMSTTGLRPCSTSASSHQSNFLADSCHKRLRHAE
jgi:hypothetical protein